MCDITTLLPAHAPYTIMELCGKQRCYMSLSVTDKLVFRF